MEMFIKRGKNGLEYEAVIHLRIIQAIARFSIQSALKIPTEKRKIKNILNIFSLPKSSLINFNNLNLYIFEIQRFLEILQ